MVRTLVSWPDRLCELFDISHYGGQWDSRFHPAANVLETETSYEISLDLPGLKPEQVDVEVKDGQLWVSGERTFEALHESTSYQHIERRYGSFRRGFYLPRDVAADRIDANFHHGVLTVALPKSESSRPRKITVQPGSNE